MQTREDQAGTGDTVYDDNFGHACTLPCLRLVQLAMWALSVITTHAAGLQLAGMGALKLGKLGLVLIDVAPDAKQR